MRDLALIYPQFVVLFEKEVTAMQARIDALRQLERVHNIINPILRRANLPNDCTIALEAGNCVRASFKALPDDRLDDFNKLCADIGRGFKDAEMHNDGTPSTSHGGYSWNATWAWHLTLGNRKWASVTVILNIPSAGLKDFEWVPHQIQSTYTRYELVPRKAAERKSF